MPKKISTRIVQKHDIEANWLKATSFVPLQGELILYDADENYSYERLKIGDGITTVTNLPFANETTSGTANGNFEALLRSESFEEAVRETTQDYIREHGESEFSHSNTLERKHKAVEVNLSSSAWVNNTQTVEIDGADENTDIIVGAAPSSQSEYANAGIMCTSQRVASYYVKDTAEELFLNGDYNEEEDFQSNINWQNGMSYSIMGENLNNYITSLQDADNYDEVQFCTGLSVTPGKTYYFKTTLRLNELATVGETFFRTSINIDNVHNIYPYTPNALGQNDAASYPTFRLTKEWKTIEFTYTPNEDDIAEGNEVKINFYKGPKAIYNHPIDMKDFFVGEDSTTNLIQGFDLSQKINIADWFDSDQTLTQGGTSYLHCSYNVDSPVIMGQDSIFEADKVYEMQIKTRLHDSSSVDSSNIELKAMSDGKPLSTRLMTTPYIVLNVANDANFNANCAMVSSADNSFEYATLNGINCVKCNYSTPWGNKKANFYIMPKFNTSGLMTTAHKYMCVTYLTETTDKCELRLFNNKSGENVQVAPDTSGSNGNWITSDIIDLSSGLVTRFAETSHCTLQWNCANPNASIYIKEIVFFTSLEQANQYYGEEEPSSSKFFHITKDWRTVTLRIEPKADELSVGKLVNVSLQRYPSSDESTLQPFDIDFVSIKPMTPVGALTFECDSTPTEDVTANIVVLGG